MCRKMYQGSKKKIYIDKKIPSLTVAYMKFGMMIDLKKERRWCNYKNHVILEFRRILTPMLVFRQLPDRVFDFS